MGAGVGVRWTLGDVSRRGFEALRLSAWGAFRIFGPEAAYAVCVNGVPAAEARERAGELPAGVRWREVTRADAPPFLLERLDGGMAQGVAWKFAPLRIFPDRFELALDNDCVLWSAPPALAHWLAQGEGCLMAEDVRRCLGAFEALCGPGAVNSGLRGLPPGFDLEGALRAALAGCPAPLRSELDEQGLQAAALSREQALALVPLDDLAVCSPFPPHRPGPGRCGVHFVGLNARALPWEVAGRPASELTAALFDALRPEVEARLGLSGPRTAPRPPAAASLGCDP